ncbi:MAG: prepilin-type N-terminal cleavage/methylation domain-containing protein [Candidatus Aceula meridiana]|nr:prepilin-type N-terminal cleavage/methylation domain-containing protein [Candidatus Aceula meridiana]
MIKQKKAFTLIELMVTLLLFTIILTAIYSTFIISTRFYQTDEPLVTLQQQARQGMNWLVKDLRSSITGSIAISYGGPGIDTITFNTPTRTGIQYYVTSGQLIREYPAGTTRIIANNISSLDYVFGGSALRITLTTSTTSFKRPLSIQLREKITLRN